jgi:hypothetical protein
MRWWDPLGYKLERTTDNAEAKELVRAWRRNRIIALVGLACALVLVALSLAQIFGLVSRPMPLALWVVFGVAFCVIMMINLVRR